MSEASMTEPPRPEPSARSTLNTDPRADEILDIVAKETGVARDKLLPDAELAALDIPSLDMVQAIFAIEERFEIDLPVVNAKTGAEFTTVGALVDHVLHTLEHATPA